MKCSKCGAELSDDTRFCSYCGEKVETDTFDSINKNNREPIVEEVSNQTNFLPEKEKKSIVDNIKAHGISFWNKLSFFEKLTTVTLTIFTLMCLVAFIAGKVFAGIIALLSVALTVVALLMKKQIIKAPKGWLNIVALVVAIFLIVPYFLLFAGSGSNISDDREEFNWSNLILGEVIPQPTSNVGKIITNTENNLSVYISRISTDQFYDYIKGCKDKGFTVDAEQLTSSFDAYNESGYELSLFYTDSDKEMHIDVDAPVKYGELKWSDSGLGKLLPKPVSKVGEIKKDDDKGFEAIVADTSIEDFKAYVKQCSDKGFSIEAKESDKSYAAKNADGYKLSVEYTGRNVISISVDEPEYQVSIEVECVKNWIFSKYDVKIYIDDFSEDTLAHGTTETYEMTLKKGAHKIKFVSAEDDSVTGEVEIDVSKDDTFKFKISCSSSGIDVDVVSGKTEDNSESMSETSPSESKTSEPDKEGTNSETSSAEKPSPVFYSTNDYETAKKGNTGVFAYVDSGKLYDIYYIIDFDEGYVYYFTDGNGESFCDRLKIESGDLNSKIIITYHDGGTQWSYKFHFKYANHPEKLIMVDQNGFELEYSTTDLDDALSIRDTKTIKDY